MVERLRERVTTEQLNQRVLRLLAEIEAALQPAAAGLSTGASGQGSRRRRGRQLGAPGRAP
jgi:hypothetical protein